jgi:predicted RNA-binding protein associated with RNAse of E/G family
MTRQIRIHYHRPGKGTTVFEEAVVLDRPDVKVTLLRSYRGTAASAGGVTILEDGAPIVWYIFPSMWRDIGRFHLNDGSFTGWYTNLRYPAVFDGDDWTCTDLFLDHWLAADGAAAWLDEDELAQARRAGLVDDATATRIDQERRAIDAEVAAGSWPPAIAREIDLGAALQALVP